MLRDGKHLSSPVQIASAERSKEDKLFKMKTKLNTPLEKEPLVEKARYLSQVTKFTSPGSPASKPQVTSPSHSPMRPVETLANAASKSKMSKKSNKAKSPVLAKKQNQNADLALSRRLINKLILVSADEGRPSKLDEKIETQAKAALERKIKQPLQGAPPRYLQRASLGTKYQF